MHAFCSLDNNLLCGVNKNGLGKFTLDAINAICDALTKSNVQSIRCSLFVQHVQHGYPPFSCLTMVACILPAASLTTT